MNCIIVDDEPLAREGMLLLLQDIGSITVKGCFNGVKKAREFLNENEVDLIFLDIEMPGINGLDFASSVPRETLIIFTTAYSQYALKSYEVEAIDYLVKPIEKSRLQTAIEKALTYHNLLKGKGGEMEGVENEYMLVKSDRRYHKILFTDIRYIEGLKDYVVIHLDDSKMVTAMNLKTIHGNLNTKQFVRVSKSYVVNLSHIDSFDNHTVYIKSAEIPVGDVYRKDFFELYLGRSQPDKL